MSTWVNFHAYLFILIYSLERSISDTTGDAYQQRQNWILPHKESCARLLWARLWPRESVKVRERKRDKNRKREGGGREFWGWYLRHRRERNPWEFSSLACESNSSSRKRQTFSSEPVVRNTSSRWAKSLRWVQGSKLILPWCATKVELRIAEVWRNYDKDITTYITMTHWIQTSLYNTTCSP